METHVNIWDLAVLVSFSTLLLSWKQPPNDLVHWLRCRLPVLFPWGPVSGPQLSGQLPCSAWVRFALISPILILISSFSGEEVTPSESSSHFLCPDEHRGGLGGEGFKKKKNCIVKEMTEMGREAKRVERSLDQRKLWIIVIDECVPTGMVALTSWTSRIQGKLDLSSSVM